MSSYIISALSLILILQTLSQISLCSEKHFYEPYRQHVERRIFDRQPHSRHHNDRHPLAHRRGTYRYDGRSFDPELDSYQIYVPLVNEPLRIETNRSYAKRAQNINDDSKYRNLNDPSKSKDGLESETEKIPVLKPFNLSSFTTTTSTPKPSTENPNPLCPPDIEDIKLYHRYYNESEKCFIPGKGENPCNENMQFYLIPGDRIYGDCDCKIFAGCDYRPLLYSPQSQKCFHIFSQGPCKEDEWYILDSSSAPACTKRPCAQNDNSTSDLENTSTWFLHESQCYQLGTQAFCPPGQIAQFSQGDIGVKCVEKPIKTPICGTQRVLIGGAPTLPCGAGQKKSGSGPCGGTVAFD